MIEFTHHGIKVKCKPERAMQYRAAMDKPPKIKVKVDRRFDCMRRHYPKFYAGLTTTADYVREYASINNHQHLIGLEYTHADRLAPMLDASAPEVLEELDADYVPTAKARKITPKQAIIQALDALKAGDMDTAQCILEEALK
tara:strand:- start:2580 stop:3005 length:426 start_codon:yes stop_codon:yes gene_type:complete